MSQGQARPPVSPLGRLGLRLGLSEGGRSLVVALGAGLAFGGWMVLADATFLGGAVPPVQHWMVANIPAAPRLALAWRGVLFDELALRLGCLTALVWAAQAVGLAGWRARWPAILLVAFVVWPLWASTYIAALDCSALTLIREVLLHGAAGTLWGWLYVRHGWLAGLVGHGAAHLVLQPLLFLTV